MRQTTPWIPLALVLVAMAAQSEPPLAAVELPQPAGEAEPRLRLRFDPFAPLRLGALAHDDDSDGASPSRFAPVLLGTLVAGERSLANIGGIVLGVGEEAQGHRLLEVHDDRAVFERDGQRVELRVDPEETPR